MAAEEDPELNSSQGHTGSMATCRTIFEKELKAS